MRRGGYSASFLVPRVVRFTMHPITGAASSLGHSEHGFSAIRSPALVLREQLVEPFPAHVRCGTTERSRRLADICFVQVIHPHIGAGRVGDDIIDEAVLDL